MDFQNLIVLMMIFAAALYVGNIIRRKILLSAKNSSCESDCGCSGPKSKTANPAH